MEIPILDISTICLGTMTWGEQNTQEEGFEQMDYALDKGDKFLGYRRIICCPTQEKKLMVILKSSLVTGLKKQKIEIKLF